MLAFLSSVVIWAFMSAWLWPHLINWTTGFWGNWLTAFFVVTWPLIILSLPAMIAISMASDTVKSIVRR